MGWALFKKLDWVLVVFAMTLVAFGLVSLYASGGETLLNFKKQILWLASGFFLMILVGFFDYRILKNYQAPSLLLYGISTLLLLGILIFGTSVRGAESWYRIGFVSIEPVEFVKIALIILFAKYFSMRHIEMYRMRHIITSGIYVFVPAFLVFLQPDIGSVLILLSIWLGIMILAGIHIKRVAQLALIGVVAFFLAWNFAFHPYQKERLLTFLSPRSDPRGAGYNVLQSVIAIGSGGIWGKGIGEGTQTQLGFLPEPNTDFIYAAIAEEMGLAGIILLLSCFLLFLRHVMNIAKSTGNNFARLVAGGFFVMVFSEILINIGMTLGLLPITGIPLPFVSYGGSSMISLFAILGVLQSIRLH
jgi:rod shape determining protein RodA